MIIPLAIFVYLGNPKITFNPFSFYMPYWKQTVGYILLAVALSLLSAHHREIGRDDFVKTLKEYLNKGSNSER